MTAARLETTAKSGAAFDVVIIGGGAAGTCAAVALGRRNIRTALIDLHDEYPVVFRADKVAGGQVDLMRRLGIVDGVAAKSAKIQSILNTRGGRVIDYCGTQDYGLPYEDLVNVLRGMIGTSVTRVFGRVADLQAGPDHQRVILSDGRVLVGRLIVLATGGGEALKRKLGIKRETLRASHSVSIGFDIIPKRPEAVGTAGLTCYGNGNGDCVDYVTVFPFRRAMRVNIFVYRDPRDAWLRALQNTPAKTLFETLPGFVRFLGDFDLASDMQMRPTDLYVSTGCFREGAVLIGDAFRNGCPSVGRGLTKVFTDVDRLCNHYLPHWLLTPGMSTEKIASFYNDAEKQAADLETSSSSEYRRAMALEESLKWRLHRQRFYLQRRARSWVADLTRPLAARDRPA